MLQVILLALLAAAAHRTRPSAASLRKHLERDSEADPDPESAGAAGAGLRVLSQFIQRVAGPPAPTYRTRDLFVAVAALTSDGRAFIGAFNSWTSVPREWTAILFADVASSGADAAGASAAAKSEDEGDALFEQALKRKAARDYADSARLFTRAAQTYAGGSTQLSQLESAKSHMEAAKCYTILNQSAYARSANICAADIYATHATHLSHAVDIHTKIAAAYRTDGNLLDSLAHYDKSLDLLRAAGDGGEGDEARIHEISIDRVAVLSMLGRHQEAASVYESLAAYAAAESVLRFSVRGFLSDSLFSHVALKDITTLRTTLERVVDTYAVFIDIEPVWRMFVDAWENGSVEMFDYVAEKFRSVNAVGVGSWQDRAITSVRDAIAADLT
ncbi:hypothetical protein HDU83_001731 [Entophlyctis luteolus]|nr:hypothetical protein HDU83_001731 [Entophlyctis luteolus]KAJ3394081.1 hypothetical protein HDU84_000109 [Entophlyctis sp. JEL0112]